MQNEEYGTDSPKRSISPKATIHQKQIVENKDGDPKKKHPFVEMIPSPTMSDRYEQDRHKTQTYHCVQNVVT
jgi:hypothetical protein